MAQWASYNPWNVSSIHEFWSLKCPECVFDSKEEEIFQDHALRNHPLSFLIFGKTLNDVKEEYVDPFFETVECHNNPDQISIKKELLVIKYKFLQTFNKSVFAMKINIYIL